MKTITVYHGSDRIIEEPVHTHGAHHDFGAGFYVTPSRDLAHEWACRAAKDGIINSYSLHIDDLQVLDFTAQDHTLLEWAATVLKHRTDEAYVPAAEARKQYLMDNFAVDISGYDVIIGYRADDSYFSFAQDFVSGTISLGKLSEAMRLGRLGEQIVLKSKRAFERIKYIGNELALAEEYSIKKANRDALARRAYRQTKAASADINDIYILDIMREGIKNGDPRLR